MVSRGMMRGAAVAMAAALGLMVAQEAAAQGYGGARERGYQSQRGERNLRPWGADGYYGLTNRRPVGAVRNGRPVYPRDPVRNLQPWGSAGYYGLTNRRPYGGLRPGRSRGWDYPDAGGWGGRYVVGPVRPSGALLAAGLAAASLERARALSRPYGCPLERRLAPDGEGGLVPVLVRDCR